MEFVTHNLSWSAGSVADLYSVAAWSVLPAGKRVVYEIGFTGTS
jgi:hypothetical protein